MPLMQVSVKKKIKMKARLIVTYKCNRDCPGCCNKNWKYDPAQEIDNYDYEEIIITGGEPLLFLEKVIELIKDIRTKSSAKILLYTAQSRQIMKILNLVDGVCLTLHEQADVHSFNYFVWENKDRLAKANKSLRLNVFKEAMVNTHVYTLGLFKVKDNIEWLKDCPLPSDEKLFKLKELF